MREFWKVLNETCARLGIKPTERVVFVRIATQTMGLFEGGMLAREYAVSTSARPPSNVRDSLGTPRGLHEIAGRIGEGQPSGMVFKGRKPTGRIFSGHGEHGEHDGALRASGGCNPAPGQQGVPAALITTRILWLRGLEPGVNLGGEVDSHSRHIYIHGTNREDLIGTPQSAGCVVMRNADVIDLHDRVRAGDMVLIG